MTVRFRIRGGEDWLLYAERVDAPDDDRVYVAVTELWPVWLDIERRFGVGTSRSGLHNADVLALVSASAHDRDFEHRPSWLRCDACGEWPRFQARDGIRAVCGCDVDSHGDAVDVEAALDAAVGVPAPDMAVCQ